MGEVGDVAATCAPLGRFVLASGTRGSSGSATVGIKGHEIGQVEIAAILGWRTAVPCPLEREEDETIRDMVKMPGGTRHLHTGRLRAFFVSMADDCMGPMVNLDRTARDNSENPGRVVRGFPPYFFLVLIVSTTVVRGFALAVDFFTNRPVIALRATFLVFRAIA